MTFRMRYVGIRVKDMDESVRFYTEIFGMKMVEPVTATPPTRGKVATLKSPDSEQMLELNYYEAGSPFGSDYSNGEDLDHLAFDCEDLEKSVEDLERKGVEVMVRPKEIGSSVGWNEAFVKDPNGIWIELLQRRD